MRRVVITGIGAVTPVGNDTETTWQNLLAGKSGIGHIDIFDASAYPVRIAGLVKDFDLSRYFGDEELSRHLSRAAQFGMAATVQALEDAGIKPDTYRPEEKGISMGGSVGRPTLQELSDIIHTYQSSEGRELIRQEADSVMEREQNVAMAAMAVSGDFEGPFVSVSTACSGSAHALGEAFRLIQEGEARLMIAGGFDALTSYLDLLGFALLGALTKDYNDDPQRASRPFDRDRSGFVLGEGAVVAVLEDLESARARGARIYAEVVGYGSSLNAYRITDAPPDGGGATLAIASAVKESGLGTDEMDYVVAHGTSTPGNDLSETTAIKKVFGDDAYRLAVSSPKSMTGHLTGAAGGLNLLAGSLAIRDQIVPPTVNYENPDPKLDLNYVPNTAQKRPVHAVLVDAFAFGGTNASLVIKSLES